MRLTCKHLQRCHIVSSIILDTPLLIKKNICLLFVYASFIHYLDRNEHLILPIRSEVIPIQSINCSRPRSCRLCFKLFLNEFKSSKNTSVRLLFLKHSLNSSQHLSPRKIFPKSSQTFSPASSLSELAGFAQAHEFVRQLLYVVRCLNHKYNHNGKQFARFHLELCTNIFWLIAPPFKSDYQYDSFWSSG